MAFDKTEPVAGSYPNSAPMRENFTQLAKHHIGATAPPSPELGYIWLDTSTVDNWKVNLYSQDGASPAAWVTLFENAQLNPRAILAFTQLIDVPVSYAGHSGKVVAVKSGEDGLEFVAGGMSAHALVGALHTASGLTPGDVLTALSATTFAFQAAGGGGGVVEKAIDHTWTGDGTAGRIIDLGDDYDLVFLFLEENENYNNNHMALAYAFRSVYGIFPEVAAGYARHYSMASGDNYFQGKLFGGDANKIKLGSASTSNGANVNGKTYRLIGFKFSSME